MFDSVLFCIPKDFQAAVAERLFSLYITLFSFSLNTKNAVQNLLPDNEVLEVLFFAVSILIHFHI